MNLKLPNDLCVPGVDAAIDLHSIADPILQLAHYRHNGITGSVSLSLVTDDSDKIRISGTVPVWHLDDDLTERERGC